MAKKEPLYPHVPKSNKLERVVREVEETVRRQGRLHAIDIAKMSERESVSPAEVVKRLPEDITLDEETGYFIAPSTPVYYGVLGFSLWTAAATRYGPDAANHLTVKMDELIGAAKECKLTGPNGVFDHYDDFSGMVHELEEKAPPTEMLGAALTEVAWEKTSTTLKTDCNCRVE